jgi:DNA-directed RNA polymerase specialized sigma24 family protein
MKHVREHVENVFIANLSKQGASDLPDWMIEGDFKRLLPQIERAIAKVLEDAHIPSFTDDDLTSLMMLKAHKLLRCQKYDFERSAYTFFYVAFKNMVRDILRCQNSIMAQDMRWDVLDKFSPISWHIFEEYETISLQPAQSI